jgi:hypothetical protein
MTKLKLGLAAGVAAILAFGVASCGQTTTVEEAPAEVTEPAAVEPAPAVDPAAVPPADGTTTTTTPEGTTTTTTP